MRSVLCEYKLEPQTRTPPECLLALVVGEVPEPSRVSSCLIEDEAMLTLLSNFIADTTDVLGDAANHALDTCHPLLDSEVCPRNMEVLSSPKHQQHDAHNDRTPAVGINASIDGRMISSRVETPLIVDDIWMPDPLDPTFVVPDMLGHENETRQHGRGHSWLEDLDPALCVSSLSCTIADADATVSSISGIPTQQWQTSVANCTSYICPDGSLTSPLPLGRRTKPVIQDPSGNTKLSDLVKASYTPHDPPMPGMISLEEALRMTAEYPLRMLTETFCSPFIHPRLCRQSPLGVPEPIAVAMACVGMKLHSEQSGLAFVCDTFRERRDKLIKQLVRGLSDHWVAGQLSDAPLR